jgi:hypothetical protein
MQPGQTVVRVEGSTPSGPTPTFVIGGGSLVLLVGAAVLFLVLHRKRRIAARA